MPARLRSFARALLGRARLEDDMETELSAHIEDYAAELVRGGVAPDEARRRARLEFGSLERVKESCREARGLRWPDELARNLRYAARMLRKSPGFTAAAVLTLALCIGANTAIFSIVDAVLLRPLPYPQPDRLALLTRHVRYKGLESFNGGQTGATWELVRDNVRGIDAAVFSGGASGVNLAVGGRAVYVRQQRVSAGFFRVLGVAPLFGREFTLEEDRPGGPAVTILSYGMWRRMFGENRSILGRTILLRGEPFIVIGVMPAGFRTSVPADLWTPLRPSTRGEGQGINYRIVARLRPGVSRAQANGELEALGAEAFRRMELGPGVWARLELVSLQRGLAQNVRPRLLILWAAVGLVLLIGCVNVAGLLLARSATRTREIGTRMALGGGRSAVVRQLLTESLLLALCGGAAGVALGYGGMLALRPVATKSFDVWQQVTLDSRVLLASLALALLVSLLVGILPAREAGRVDLRAALVESGGRGAAGGRARWPRRVLVAGEIALGIVLLVGAGLLVRSFAFLNGLNPGFDANHVLTASLSLQDVRYRNAAQINRLYDETLARIRTLPGVEAVAVGLTLPYQPALNDGMRRLDGPNRDSERRITDVVYITPDYFRVLRIPLRRGRVFRDGDNPQAPPVAVVNEAFVRRYLRNQDPVGSHIELGGTREIVGVVGDVQLRPGWGGDVPLSPEGTAYIPAAQLEGDLLMIHTWFAPSWLVRSAGTERSLIAGIERAVEAVDPQLPFSGFHSMRDVQSQALATQRFQAALLASLAGLALLLGAVGVYGLIANSVTERTRELGIRLALGATLGQAIRAVALPGVLLALAGAIAGGVLARFAAQVLRHLIWGVTPADPATFAAAALVLLLVAAVASLLPALRIARLDPARTLRVE